MKLRPHHVALLTPLERKVYAPLIGKVDFSQEKIGLYISQSHRYIPGDEDVLPFPERSKRGIMLYSLSQHLAADYTETAVVYKPSIPRNILHLKRKILSLGADKAYAIPPNHLLAAIHANGQSPFDFFRNPPHFNLKNIPKSDLYIETPSSENVLCALNPPAETIIASSEYSILGILLRDKENANFDYSGNEKGYIQQDQATLETDIGAASEADQTTINSSEVAAAKEPVIEEPAVEDPSAADLVAPDSSALTRLPLFAEAAHLGLTDVTDVGEGRFWLTSEDPLPHLERNEMK